MGPTWIWRTSNLKQLLARSRYVFYKLAEHWTDHQKERADLLFERYPDLKEAYELSMGLSNIFEHTVDKLYGWTRLAKWHEMVPKSGFKAFKSRPMPYSLKSL